MIVETEIIVLNRLKYSDTSLIIKGYTKAFGLKTFIAKGARNKKNSKQSLYQSFSVLEVQLYQKESSNISTLRSANSLLLNTLVFDLSKSSIALFLSEVVLRYVKEEEQNIELYSFFKSKIITLIEQNEVQEINKFTLAFLLELTVLLGIIPQNSIEPNTVFCLEEGCFLDIQFCRKPLSKEKNQIFIALLKGDQLFRKQERRLLIRVLLEYMDTQLSSSGKIKSLEIFEEISA
jgi:DNA repair protein RecO (recombination protein O)